LQGVSTTALLGAQAVSFDIEDRTEKLNLIADWRDELSQLIVDAQEDPDELNIDWLRAEVDRFSLACKGVRT
jgi:hypothetical protein